MLEDLKEPVPADACSLLDKFGYDAFSVEPHAIVVDTTPSSQFNLGEWRPLLRLCMAGYAVQTGKPEVLPTKIRTLLLDPVGNMPEGGTRWLLVH